VRYAKVVIMAVSPDPLLTDLRSAVVAAGGSVYYMYQSVQGISAMLPGGQILAIAARPDVDSISPNRLAAKAASLLEMTSGTSNVRTTMLGVRTGYDGTGVGIAILDSGIYYKHGAFAADGAGNRVRKIVSMNNMSDGEAMGVGKWTAGVDTSATYAPGSPTETTYESRIDNSSNTDPDDYGHGTHVASIAAGRSVAGAPNYARRSIVLGSR
jgi:serine protease AprX